MPWSLRSEGGGGAGADAGEIEARRNILSTGNERTVTDQKKITTKRLSDNCLQLILDN